MFQCSGASLSQFSGKFRAQAPMAAITYSLIAGALAPRAVVSSDTALTKGGTLSMPVPISWTHRTPEATAAMELGLHPPKSTSPRVPGVTPPVMSITSTVGNRSRIRATDPA